MTTAGLEQAIGARIRSIRKSLRLKLDEVAVKAEVSTGLLSKIENGRVSSPISTYARVATALGVSFSELIGDNDSKNCVVVRKDESEPLHGEKSAHSYLFQSLGYKWPNSLLNFFLLTYHPQKHSQSPPSFTFPGEEFIYVLEGQIEFFHGEEVFVLNQGDCIFLKGNIPHGGRAYGGSVAKALNLSVPVF